MLALAVSLGDIKSTILSSGLRFVYAGLYTQYERLDTAAWPEHCDLDTAEDSRKMEDIRGQSKMARAFCHEHDSASACFNGETTIRGGHSALCHHDLLAISLMRAALITFILHPLDSFTCLTCITRTTIALCPMAKNLPRAG